jgi:aspartyl protease family protein
MRHIILLLLFSHFSYSQNPLVFSFFHEEYYSINIVEYAENKGKLDNKICQYLISSTKLENKLAVVDAVFEHGEKTENGNLFQLFLEDKYGFQSEISNENKFILAYLYSTTEFERSQILLQEIEPYYSKSLAYNVVKLMIDIYQDDELKIESNKCDNWIKFQRVDLNKNLSLDLNNKALNLIAQEINELKKYCDDVELIVTESKRNFDKKPMKIIKKIKLKEIGGVYSVPLEINGVLTLDFIYDSGASYVLLPEDVFRVLLRTETVKREDIIGVERFSIADGSVIEKPVFILKQLKVGNITVTNIKASVGNMDSELLLGQSFQKKFKKIRVDNSDKTLNIEEY